MDFKWAVETMRMGGKVTRWGLGEETYLFMKKEDNKAGYVSMCVWGNIMQRMLCASDVESDDWDWYSNKR